MTDIASHQNPRLKALRRLQGKRERARLGRFVAEGEDLIAAAARAGRPALEGYRLAGSGLGGPDFLDVERYALDRVSTLGSGTRVMGVYEQRWVTARGPLCVYLHGVGDPGNVGTVLRSAQAFGASCVALGPGCADPHSPKAVRASMGAIFAVAIARVSEVGELPGERVALAADAGEPLQGPMDPAGEAITLLVGAEREGLPEELLGGCERVARIPIASESLNAAMAATVALYEMTRRSNRRPARPNDTVPASRSKGSSSCAQRPSRRSRRPPRARRWRSCGCATSGVRPSCRSY
jgi:TrmH family RNA methyltransferase